MSSPRSIARVARKRGLKGFALTDHDNTRGWKEAREAARDVGLEFIQGIEVTCFDDSGHRVELIGLFVESNPGKGFVLDVARRIRDQGGVVVVPHPFDLIRAGWGGLVDNPGYLDAVETFNARTHEVWRLRKALNTAMALGKSQTGGSDAHAPFEVGSAYTLSPGSDAQGLHRALLAGNTSAGGSISSRGVHVFSTLSKLKAIPRVLGLTRDESEGTTGQTARLL